MSADVLRDVTAVVLAGGLGTRLRHLLGGHPKPLAVVAGRPFIDWLLLFLRHCGLTRVVISTGYRWELVHKHLSRLVVPGLAIRCVAEAEPLGTAGGFLNAVAGAGLASDWWLVVNGDTLVLTGLARFVAAVRDARAEAGMVSVWVDNVGRFGRVLTDASGFLTGFEEKDGSGPGPINAGVYLFGATVLDRLPRRRPLSFEREVFPEWVTTGAVRVKVCEVRAPFLDIGTPESLAGADQFIQEHREWFAA